MANEEHVALLKQGTEVWNQWREENPKITPDLSKILFICGKLSGMHLSEADLSGADLSEADLSEADLFNANLREASLIRANLIKADLDLADLSGANLSRASLGEANLSGTNFTGADLSEVELVGADLSETIFHGANLRGVSLFGTFLSSADLTLANLAFAVCGSTYFANVDLSQINELDTVIHYGPSTIGIDTIYRSGGNIPETFLRGAGVPDKFIAFIKSLSGQAVEFYSCFISHSSKDKEFAERLYADLQNNGVRCWYAPHHMEIGAPILNEIDSAIRLHDKLLLILSENSVGSRWVEHEVLSATTKEYRQERDTRTLFPIRLDDTVMDTDVQWARNLKETRHIADFTHWKDHDSYKKAFDRLLRDLKAKG